ncbi:sulfotransferase family 2A member 1 [Rhinolophus ferrumequinum]|uniref:Sulfotransferase n=1 Tax=Rhinolophus ferrumequinum TaxID=59479 RepID=A0A7J7SL21_RHIFE|nr:sulfotransferase 2A1 isoform X1 [Rhinolophus ferrumequinum]KAF6289156.1 sulfotransferase family 2A member 1 [Rhinolophus ferrumequinum]
MSDGFVWFEGIPFPVVDFTPEHMREVQENFVFKDEDVLTLSFPKSGTNWLIEILSLIFSKGDPKWVQSVPIWERSPWLETMYGYKSLKDKEGPRFITSHVPIHLFPKSVFKSKAKVIYLIRNPRDILVSGYFFWIISNFVKKPESLEQYFEWFIQGNAKSYDSSKCARHCASNCAHKSEHNRGVPAFTEFVIHPLFLPSTPTHAVAFGSWFDHIRGWTSMKGKENFLILSYEELKQDTRSAVQKLCQFLGKKLEPEELNSVLKNSSFQVMKENKMSNYTLLRGWLLDQNNGSFLRKGISGDWKNYFTVAQAEVFDKIFQEKTADLPQELFPWE